MKDKLEQFKETMRTKQELEEQAAQNAGEESSKVAELEQQIEALSAQAEELKKTAQEHQERYVRLYADFENFRKRVSREKEEAARYGVEKILHELLPVLDGLEKALEHASDVADKAAIVSGVQMVLKQFSKALESVGVQSLEAIGKPFDPNLHEAVGHHESAAHEPNTVMQEYRRGYKLNDRLLRPALVTVAKPPQSESED